ncbi:MAG: asparagine synthase-related protein [Ignavibacteria bacterium]
MKTTIIPSKQTFYKKEGSSDLNLKAICIFCATGFFLEKDTYYNDLEVMQPFTEYVTDENNFLKKAEQYWEWHYDPKDISLEQATDEFAHLYENITKENLKDKAVILPLSGGLDSRTQSAVLGKDMNVNSYSYKFENSFDETKYGKEIAKVRSFPFHEYIIMKGYLWNVIEELAEINQCYTDFTNPRQMAVINEIKELGDIFFLGHWGDVLFDGMGVRDDLTLDDQLKALIKKLVKRGGIELADSLWKMWGIEGSFEEHFKERLSGLLQKIKIDNANARIRAFKSMYWAPRWTSVSLEIFSKYKPVYLPYYDDEMCKFICKIPEHLLNGRQIQINYIKMKNPGLAKIAWQNYEPLNLYNYKDFENTSRIPGRAIKKMNKMFKEKILNKKNTTRNWEIQFTGESNDLNLRKYLFENKNYSEFISPEITKTFYDKFKNEDSVYYSHPVSMLLTLAVFSKRSRQ